MKHRTSDAERDNDSDAPQQRDPAPAAGSTNGGGTVASIHEAAGNQAVQQLHERGALQASMDVSHPDDREEREAERVAEEVLHGDESTHEGRTPTITRRTGDGTSGTGTLDSKTESEIRAVTSGGRPLSDSTRSFFESRFGRDFSDVRVHTGSQADEAARSIDAEAFTLGSDVAVRNDSYDPNSEQGKKLLAHELTHVVQQRNGGDAHQGANSGKFHDGGVSHPVVQRQGGAVESIKNTVEGLDNLEKISKKGKQQGDFNYTTDYAKRMSDDPSQMDGDYSAKVFEVIHQGEKIFTSAQFHVHWQGNNKGEIGGAHVLPDAGFKLGQGYSVMADSIDVDFVAMDILPQGDNPAEWPMRWSYEGWYDRSGIGNYYFRGKFDITAIGGFKIVNHKIRNKGLPLAPRPEAVIKTGEPVYGKVTYKPEESKQKVKEGGGTPVSEE